MRTHSKCSWMFATRKNSWENTRDQSWLIDQWLVDWVRWCEVWTMKIWITLDLFRVQDGCFDTQLNKIIGFAVSRFKFIYNIFLIFTVAWSCEQKRSRHRHGRSPASHSVSTDNNRLMRTLIFFLRISSAITSANQDKERKHWRSPEVPCLSQPFLLKSQLTKCLQ